MAELRELGEDELLQKLSGLKKELMQYRFQAKTGKLERHKILGEVRRNIARVLTVVNEKKKAEVKA